MKISPRSFVPVAALAFAAFAYAQAPTQAQKGPEPLNLTPAPHQSELSAAGQAGAQAQAQTAQGELLEVDAKANTLSIRTAGAEMQFRYNEQTKVTGAQKGVAGLATMTGSQVTIQYRKEGNANLATSIEVRSSGGDPGAPAPKPER